MTEKHILVLCTGNSCRSQMAEGWLRHYRNLLGRDIIISSAGIEAHGLNPRAVSVMMEDGIDISHQESQVIDDIIESEITDLITVCDHAAEVCPVLPGIKSTTHQSFKDPAKAKGSEENIMNEFRQVRNEIRDFCLLYLQQY